MLSRRLRRAAPHLLALLLALVLPLMAATGFAATAVKGEERPVFTPSAQTSPPPPARGLAIRAGLMVRNIYDLNLSGQSFMAEGWYWLSWNDAVQAVMKRHGVAPAELIQFANEIEPGQYRSLEVLRGVDSLSPASGNFLYVKFSGKFYINRVVQYRAPFDQQHLQIDMEVSPAALASGADRVELVPVGVDQFPIAGEFASVSGYRLMGSAWRRLSVEHVEPMVGASGIRAAVNRYSRITADLVYAPDRLAVFLKWLLPLLAVMTIVILAPSIDGMLGDSRLAIPSAALLTLVVLHDGYKSNFPPVPYMTYLDKIYTYSYVVCLAIFLLFLVGTNAHAACRPDRRHLVTTRVNQLDGFVQLAAVVGFVVVAWLSWFV